MKLRGRNLSLNLSGSDVALLHRELQQIGLIIPVDEVRRQMFGPMTVRVVAEFQRTHGLRPTGIVDEMTAAAINREVALVTPRTVKGLVTDDHGNPLPNLSVTAVDKDLRCEEPLGQALTGNDGVYQITYTARQFQRAEKSSADLIVRVLNRDQILATSEVLFNA